MKKIFVLFLFAFTFSACAHNAGVAASEYQSPDPACPDGYTWATKPDDALERGACLRVGITLTENCRSYRDTELTPAYAFWACGNSTMTLAPNPWL